MTRQIRRPLGLVQKLCSGKQLPCCAAARVNRGPPEHGPANEEWNPRDTSRISGPGYRVQLELSRGTIGRNSYAPVPFVARSDSSAPLHQPRQSLDRFTWQARSSGSARRDPTRSLRAFGSLLGRRGSRSVRDTMSLVVSRGSRATRKRDKRKERVKWAIRVAHNSSAEEPHPP